MINPKFYKILEHDNSVVGLATASELRLLQTLDLLSDAERAVEISFEEYCEFCKDPEWFDLQDTLEEYTDLLN